MCKASSQGCLKTMQFIEMPPACEWTKVHLPKGQYRPSALALKIAFRELVAVSTAMDFKWRRVVHGGSPLRILARARTDVSQSGDSRYVMTARSSNVIPRTMRALAPF
jgi:hypothetical protein